ncbi:hypothetical protein SAMN03159511_4432 [Pseudomonas sp. NFACC19-2]|uniref:Uncharacterized protein n=1 Tax=Ectopseudomonas toyotomiensis TaxID=554344 RepID=A0A1I5UEJ4_9GAMM|nr:MULTISPECIES: hypothetical protein [Pseudomonas]PIA73136.1 hypothetical protein CDR19_10050 [Pseudomonas toyotomiensis]SDA68189.1 hypothetical protein SAMN03159475_3032 [Pseudomonas sp. NFPP33]SFP93437.1 hypothetical protein SAMN05216177_106164 [Pseudomonas toyotomiensis]SFW55786.1 hypothetical protein SAMN03159511_4432 [Pseudomonas sp. NFACC19-2]
MQKLPNTELLAKRTIELLGGPEEARRKIDCEFNDMKNRWEQDTVSIGRILRAHLYVEHYLTEYLKNANPRLADLNKVRISFSQKMDLLDPNDHLISDIVTGIRHLNKIRNRLAHNLSADVTTEDSKKFLSIAAFKALQNASSNPDISNADPMQVLEEFAQYAASTLNHQVSSFGSAFTQALNEASSNAPPN